MAEKRKKFKRVPAEVSVDSLTPLDISCGSTKCEDELHCFSLKPSSIKKQGRQGVCHECGADLIDWTRVHKRDIGDAEFTFSAMKSELIRHVFWHSEIDETAYNKALKDGIDQIKIKARKTLKSRVLKRTAWDGRQTPFDGSIINYAQHATATCCRKCIEVWHNIPKDRLLTDEELDFFTELVLLYSKDRIPELNE